MTDDPHDDASLVRLALTGELAAFDALARRHQPALLRFIRRRLAGADVEDAAQEVLVRAYQRLGQYRASSSFRSWLFAIAYRETVDRLRKPRLVIDRADDTASTTDPSAGLLAAERKSRLWATARAVLSDDQFNAVWLFYADEMSAKEIAEVMGRSWVSVKVMLHRARAALSDALESAEFHEVPSKANWVREGKR